MIKITALKNTKIWFALVFSLMFFLLLGTLIFNFLQPETAEAKKHFPIADSPVRGRAWWGDTGDFVYFNCLDTFSGDRLDVAGNLTTPPGFRFYDDSCASPYGVYINDGGGFSGKAWSPTKGLIAFEGMSPPPGNGWHAMCPDPSACNPSLGCIACYDEDAQAVYGWAYVENESRWLELNNATSLPTKIQSCDLVNSVWPGHNIQPGDFAGYATDYSTSSLAGDLSFNCENEVTACVLHDNYRVYLGNLNICEMSAPNWSADQACQMGALGADLEWLRSSGQQSAYEIAVDTVNTGNNPNTSTAFCWTGKIYSSSASSFALPSTLSPTCLNNLNYNANYYWWFAPV